MILAVQGLSGKTALKAAGAVLAKSQFVFAGASQIRAYGNGAGSLIAYGKEFLRALANCNSLYGPRESDPKD